MKSIAITGGTGTGKSLVVDMLKSNELLRQATFVNVNHLVHELYKDKHFEAQLLETFGTADRHALSEIVFNDPYQRKRLEFTLGVHILQQLQQLKAQAASLFIVEMPLLYELGLQQLFNKVICVTAYDNIRIQRIMARDNCTKEQAMAIIKAQLPQHVKSELADKSISNNLSNDVFLAAEVDNLAKWIVSLK